MLSSLDPRYNAKGVMIEVYIVLINSLPNEKFLDWSELKAFANDGVNLS